MTKKPTGGGFWRGVFLFLLGLTTGMGAAAAIAVYVNQLHLPFIEPPTRPPANAKDDPSEGEDDVLRFRQILRERQPAAPLREEEEENFSPPAAREFVYYLQIGAFRDRASADDLRGQMALSGRAATIKSGQAADGGELFRVWVGPYEDEDAAEGARAQLALEGRPNVTLLKTAE